MKQYPLKLTTNGYPDCHQYKINGFFISWNPDDDRFYACPRNNYTASATFKNSRSGFANVVYYAKTHDCKTVPFLKYLGE